MNNKEIYIYPAIFYQEDIGYSVTFPDIPEAITEGDTLEEAYTMAKNVLGLVFTDYESRNEKLPTPSELNKVQKEITTTNCEEEYLVLVEFDFLDYKKKHMKKSVKKTLTIPMWLNDLAEKNNINFSQLLQEALKNKLDV